MSVWVAVAPGRILAPTRLMLEVVTIGSALWFAAWNLFLHDLTKTPTAPTGLGWSIFIALTLILLCLIAAGVGVVATRSWATPLAENGSDERSNEARLPYIVVGICFTFCLPGLIASPSLDRESTLIAAVLATSMLARQYVMLRDNAALAATLLKQIDDRTADVASRDHFRVLVQNSSDAIMAVNDDLVITYASDAVETLLQRPIDELSGSRLDEILKDQAKNLRSACDRAKSGKGAPVHFEWVVTSPNARDIHVESIIAYRPEEPSVRGYVINSRDVSDRRLLERALTHRAFHDTLTGLPNRKLFTDRLQQAINRFERYGHRFALMFCDLDSFKSVNDSAGHAVGDRLLIEVGSRLKAGLRAGDTVARFGGDEFAILLEEVEEDEITAAAERVTLAIELPFHLDGKDVFVGTSVGVVVSDSAARADVDELMRNADLAMYVAKALGKNRSVRFEPSMHDRITNELELKNDLRQAVLNEELILHYQPILELESSQIVSVEALVRWVHPVRGLIPPAEFIPLCEETGIIVDLGRWVLERACTQLATWKRLYPLSAPQSVSVNLSGRQLAEGDLVDTVKSVLSMVGLEPQHLTLEVTESVLLHDVTGVVAQLAELRRIGVRLAIDDFGTGYSSLNYLRQFPIDILKIDRSFVAGIGTLEEDSLLAGAITTLGRMLELQTVAEGIENVEELAELRRLGCDMGQGYLFARPVDESALSRLLASNSGAIEPSGD